MGGTPNAVVGRAPGSQSPIISTSYRKKHRAVRLSLLAGARFAVLLLPLSGFSHAANCQPTRQAWSSCSPLPFAPISRPWYRQDCYYWSLEPPRDATNYGLLLGICNLLTADCNLLNLFLQEGLQARVHFNINIADWLIKIELTIGNWQGANECTIQRGAVNGHSYSSMAVYIVIVGIISIARSKWANESVFICFDLSSS